MTKKQSNKPIQLVESSDGGHKFGLGLPVSYLKQNNKTKTPDTKTSENHPINNNKKKSG